METFPCFTRLTIEPFIENPKKLTCVCPAFALQFRCNNQIFSKASDKEFATEWEYKYDKKGNWIKQFVIKNGEKELYRERLIIYY